MSTAIPVTTGDFEKEVLQSPIPVLVDFWAIWCGPCKAVAPSVDAIAQEFAGQVKVVKVDVDSEPQLAMQYGVQSIPMLLFFKDGLPVDQIVGAVPKPMIADRLKKVLG
ncbi:MAG: thioredoxin [bacterium]|jgi:thioredoxin